MPAETAQANCAIDEFNGFCSAYNIPKWGIAHLVLERVFTRRICKPMFLHMHDLVRQMEIDLGTVLLQCVRLQWFLDYLWWLNDLDFGVGSGKHFKTFCKTTLIGINISTTYLIKTVCALRSFLPLHTWGASSQATGRNRDFGWFWTRSKEQFDIKLNDPSLSCDMFTGWARWAINLGFNTWVICVGKMYPAAKVGCWTWKQLVRDHHIYSVIPWVEYLPKLKPFLWSCCLPPRRL